MWIAVSRFRYNTSLSYPCGEQHEELVCFYRRAVMAKGVTVPWLPLPSAILLTCCKMESPVQGCAAQPFQLFPVSAGLHLPLRGVQFAPSASLFPGLLHLEDGKRETEKEAAPFFPWVTEMCQVHANQKSVLPMCLKDLIFRILLVTCLSIKSPVLSKSMRNKVTVPKIKVTRILQKKSTTIVTKVKSL